MSGIPVGILVMRFLVTAYGQGAPKLKEFYHLLENLVRNSDVLCMLDLLIFIVIDVKTEDPRKQICIKKTDE